MQWVKAQSLLKIAPSFSKESNVTREGASLNRAIALAVSWAVPSRDGPRGLIITHYICIDPAPAQHSDRQDSQSALQSMQNDSTRSRDLSRETQQPDIRGSAASQTQLGADCCSVLFFCISTHTSLFNFFFFYISYYFKHSSKELKTCWFLHVFLKNYYSGKRKR